MQLRLVSQHSETSPNCFWCPKKPFIAHRKIYAPISPYSSFIREVPKAMSLSR